MRSGTHSRIRWWTVPWSETHSLSAPTPPPAGSRHSSGCGTPSLKSKELERSIRELPSNGQIACARLAKRRRVRITRVRPDGAATRTLSARVRLTARLSPPRFGRHDGRTGGRPKSSLRRPAVPTERRGATSGCTSRPFFARSEMPAFALPRCVSESCRRPSTGSCHHGSKVRPLRHPTADPYLVHGKGAFDSNSPVRGAEGASNPAYPSRHEGGGPAEATRTLESRLRSIKGRKFYGAFRIVPEAAEYFACVAKSAREDSASMQLEGGQIPGGHYIRHRLFEWSKAAAEGKLTSVSQDRARYYDVDRTRPELEYHRCMEEMHLLLPAQGRGPAPLDWARADGRSPSLESRGPGIDRPLRDPCTNGRRDLFAGRGEWRLAHTGGNPTFVASGVDIAERGHDARGASPCLRSRPILSSPLSAPTKPTPANSPRGTSRCARKPALRSLPVGTPE